MQASDRRGTKRASESPQEPDPKLQNARRMLQTIIDVCEVALERIRKAGDTPAYDSEQAFRLVLTLQSVLDRFADAETAAIGVPVQNNVLKSLIEQLLQSARQMLDKSAIFDADKLNALVEQLTDTVVVHETLSQLLGLFGDPRSRVGTLGERRLLEQIARSSHRESLSSILSVKLEEIDRLLEPPILLAVLRERNQLLVAANFSGGSNDSFVLSSDVAMDNVYFQKNTRLRIRALHASDQFWYAQLIDVDDNSLCWFRTYDKDGQKVREAQPMRALGLGANNNVLPMCERKIGTRRALVWLDYTRSVIRVFGEPQDYDVIAVDESVGNGAYGLWIDPRGPDNILWVHSVYQTPDRSYVLLRQAIDLSLRALVETRELRLKTESPLVSPVLIEYDSAGRAWMYYAVYSYETVWIVCADPADGTIRWEFMVPDGLPYAASKRVSMTFDTRGQLWAAVGTTIRCYRVTFTGVVEYNDDLEPLPPGEQFVPDESGGWTELRTRGDLRLYRAQQARQAAAS